MLFRRAIQADLDYVGEHSVSMGCFGEMPEQIDFVYTLEHEGKPLGIGGIKLLNLTTAWCWMDLTEEALNRKKTVYRVVRDWLDILVEDMKLTRLMAAIRTDFEEAIRTVEHLGFYQEAVMKRYFDGNDAYLYARVRWSK